MATPAPAPRAFRTSDLGEAALALSSEYSTLRIGATDRRAPFALTLSSASAVSVRVASLTLSHACILTRPLAGYVVALPVAGHVVAGTARDGRVAIVGDIGIVSTAGREVEVEYGARDCSVLTAQFERQALEDELAVILGRPVATIIDFDFALSAGPSTRGGGLRRVLDLIRDEALPDSDLMRRRMDKLAMAALLFGQRHSYSAQLERPAGFEGSGAIRRAVEVIEQRPHELTTVVDLARAVNLSVRALESGFRRHVGMPPMAYLRETRMRRVHEDLLAADPATVTATEIAQRWGFVHYGRFAADYRARFGRSPAECLRYSTRDMANPS